MEKITSFLEKYVQWVALGLGALWLVYMAWSFVLTPPAQVQGPDGSKMTGGELDKATAEGVARNLEQAINNAHVPDMQVDDFAQRFDDKMSWQNVEPVQLAQFLNSQTQNVKLPTPADLQNSQQATPTNPSQPNNPQLATVAGLPVVPTPTPVDNRIGRSAVEPVVQMIPGQPAPVVPAIAPPLVDKDWVTQAFHVSIKDITQAFTDAKIPMGQGGMTTFFLRVETLRQELLPDGEWGADGKIGAEAVIPPIDLGVPRETYPEGKVTKAVEQGFLNWARSNQPAILQPGFYSVGAGDPWAPPGEVAAQAGAFNPQMYLTGPIPDTLTPVQREDVMAARRAATKLKNQQPKNTGTRAPRPRRGAGGDAGLPEGEFAPRDPDRASFGQVRRSPQSAALEGLSPEEIAAMEGLDTGDGMGIGVPGQPQLPHAGAPGTDYPNSEFDPSTWAGTDPITIFTHDDTVQPGKTYRYRIRYTLKNPLLGAPPAQLPNPQIGNVVGITSKESEYGSAVTIPEKVQFFIASGIWGGNAKFDVFIWKDGVVQMKQFSASPGDRIGKPDADGNFQTIWTIVTLPVTRDDDRIVIVNDDGRMMSRIASKDRDDSLYKKLKADAEAAKQQQNVATAVGTVR